MSGNIRKRSTAIYGCFGVAGLITFACLARGKQRFTKDGLTKETLKRGDREREFLVYQPASLPDGEEAPGVFVYHGGTGTAKGTMNLTRFNDLREIRDSSPSIRKGSATVGKMDGRPPFPKRIAMAWTIWLSLM